MRRVTAGWFAFIVLVAGLAAGSPANAVGQGQANTALKPEALVGTYQGTATSPDGDMALTVTLKYEKDAFGGSVDAGPQGIITITGGALTADRLVLTFDMGGTPGTITCTIKDPSRIEGTWTIADASGTVTLTKTAADPTKAADPPRAADKPAPPAAADKPPANPADPISGEWDGVAGNNEMSVPFTMRLKLDGEKVTGDISSEQGGGPFGSGTWRNGALNLLLELSGMGTVTIAGALQEGKLVGSMDIGGQIQMQWAAVRK